jgi:hypothetical protein
MTGGRVMHDDQPVSSRLKAGAMPLADLSVMRSQGHKRCKAEVTPCW